MAKVIVADAGPLIGLARIGKLDLLNEVFQEVLTTRVVASECCRDVSLPGAGAIQEALNQGKILVKEVSESAAISCPPGIGEGEKSAIELALSLHLGLLIDDLPGRRLAQRHHVPILGTGGLLLLAKKQGHIDLIQPCILDLLAEGYHLSKMLIQQLLQRAGEAE